jgi:hypothetical protein
VTEVVVEVEVIVVHPDCVVLSGNPRELLAVAWDQVQNGFGESLDGLEVDSAMVGAQSSGLEDVRTGDVHR